MHLWSKYHHTKTTQKHSIMLSTKEMAALFHSSKVRKKQKENKRTETIWRICDDFVLQLKNLSTILLVNCFALACFNKKLSRYRYIRENMSFGRDGRTKVLGDELLTKYNMHFKKTAFVCIHHKPTNPNQLFQDGY